MNYTRIILSAALAFLPVAIEAQAAPAATGPGPVDVAVMYSAQRANAPAGSSSAFWMNGATGELSIPVWHNLSFVTAIAKQHTDRVPASQYSLSQFSGMGGLRLRLPNHTLFQPYAQALAGGVHGFDGYFPSPGSRTTSYDTAFAMALGGGVDLAISKHVWIRIVQADYFYTELRNRQANRQNQFRISGGIVYCFPRWFWERQ
ncbi:MAG: hypothetical protein FWD64_01490 [Acidobacteriaceae bacterium]|nr:hypothetical protein [Acidobacteriaceae bacterium]